MPQLLSRARATYHHDDFRQALIDAVLSPKKQPIQRIILKQKAAACSFVFSLRVWTFSALRMQCDHVAFSTENHADSSPSDSSIIVKSLMYSLTTRSKNSGAGKVVDSA
mgnify:CR=1 FL=1